jgi:hypothetical protein
MALVTGRTHDRIASFADTELAGVRLCAGISIIAGGRVGLVAPPGGAGGRCALLTGIRRVHGTGRVTGATDGAAVGRTAQGAADAISAHAIIVGLARLSIDQLATTLVRGLEAGLVHAIRIGGAGGKA